MSKILLICLVIVLPLLSFSQQAMYSRVRIFLDGHNPGNLIKTGIDVTGFDKVRNSVTSELSQSELKQVSKAGFRYEVLIEDVQKFYLERNKQPLSYKTTGQSTDLSEEWPVPTHFTLGTCGGFLTVDAMLEQLDLMRSLYPNLISIKHSISDSITTIEGRPIYFVKISDNPGISEPEPQVLYTGMHHAREPIGMQHLLYYMWYLLENYSSNQEVKNILDNTELYFVPVMNVDGYQYNISTNPAGAGMWRKNRRNNGDGSVGIDLNRNYGYMWGFDNEGSSPDPYSDIFRGTSPFSEPETRMMKYFCESHNFNIAINYHSYSNLFLYAWGWTEVPSPDDALLNAYASIMTSESGFTYGPGSTTIYPTNGGSDDWMYGEQSSKPKTLAFTPEVGNDIDGFWPAENNIIPLCQKNMLGSFMAAKLVGKFGEIEDDSPLFISQNTGYLNFNVKRVGLQGGTFTMSVIPLGNAFASVGPPKTVRGLELLQKQADSISYQLADVNQAGDTIRYVLVLDNGYYLVTDTVSRIFGYPFTLFSDNLDSKSNWTGTWDLTSSSWFSSPTSMTDSPLGNYSAYANRSITLTNWLAINPSILTVLEYRAHWNLENDYDFVQLKIIKDNGTTWTPLTGKYTNPGATNQLFGQPLYDGTQSDWVHEAISLNPWQNENVKFQFTLVSDGGVELDGYYFDDFTIRYLLDPTSVNDPNPSQLWVGLPSPNPSSRMVRLNYLLPLQAVDPAMKVFNASGIELFSKTLPPQGNQLEFSVENLPPGIYYLIMEAKGIPAQVRKLVVCFF